MRGGDVLVFAGCKSVQFLATPVRLQVLPPHYSGDDSYLAVVSKKLSKRDATTKIKALVELRTICR